MRTGTLVGSPAHVCCFFKTLVCVATDFFSYVTLAFAFFYEDEMSDFNRCVTGRVFDSKLIHTVSMLIGCFAIWTMSHLWR